MTAGEGGFGGGDNSRVVDTDSEFNDVGEAFAEVQVAAAEAYEGGTPGTYTFPVDVVVYGKPVVVFPPEPMAWDDYCFRVAYSFSHIDEVEDRQTGANGSFELTQDRDYWEPASIAHEQEWASWDEARTRYLAREAENEERVAEGLEPLPSEPWPGPEPQPPTFPLELCEGAPGAAPDVRPAFEAAERLVGAITPPDAHIAPGTGIAGLDGYLQTGRTMDVNRERIELPLIGWDYSADPLHPEPIPGSGMFSAYGRYTVDWGDGTVTGPHRSGGIAHDEAPSGEQVAVTHAYEDAGEYAIRLTDEWWVELQLDFLGETYTFVHHRVLPPWEPAYTFRVDEVRSVRQR